MYIILISLSLSPHTFQTLQIINITICASTNNSIYHGVMSGYLFIPFAILFIVVLLTANVPLSAFRREHLATYFAIVLSVIPVTFITLIKGVVWVGPLGSWPYLLSGINISYRLFHSTGNTVNFG